MGAAKARFEPAGLRADRRWLNGVFTSRLDVLAAKLDRGAWALATPDHAEALFIPWDVSARGDKIVLATGQRAPFTPDIKAAQGAGSVLLLQEHKRRHQASPAECPDLRQCIASRRYLIASEGDDLIAARQALLDDATAQGMETSEQGFARSRFRAIRNAWDMAILARDVRLARLDGLIDALVNRLDRRGAFRI